MASLPVTQADAKPQFALLLSMPAWAVSPHTEVTVKLTPLLAMPPTLTTTFPVVAPLGTFATILVALQLITVAAVWLKVTVLVP